MPWYYMTVLASTARMPLDFHIVHDMYRVNEGKTTEATTTVDIQDHSSMFSFLVMSQILDAAFAGITTLCFDPKIKFLPSFFSLSSRIVQET